MTAAKLRRLTGQQRTDAERGKLILESTSLIRNSGAFVIEDVIDDLLRSGAWRTYTFPDGTHHEWLDREFDYFVSAQQFEWDKMKRSITKPAVLCLVADHSGTSENAATDRRALDELRDQFPCVRFEKLVSDHVRTIAANTKKRAAFERNGKVMAAATPDKPWEFRVKRTADSSIDERAQAIVDQLLDDPKLAKRIHQMLDASVRTQRRKSGSGTGKTRTTRARA